MPAAQEVRERLDRWIAAATPAERLAFTGCTLTVVLGDGTRVGYQSEPGYLIVNGVRLYSAAFL